MNDPRPASAAATPIPGTPVGGRLAYSVVEVADMFGLSQRRIYLACKSGSLPMVPKEIAGDRVLIPAHNLAESVALMATGNRPNTQEQPQ